MKSMSRLLGEAGVSLIAGLVFLVAAPGSAVAQEAGNESRLYDENEVAHRFRDLWRRDSRFLLFGQGDRAVTSLKPTGTTPYGRGMEYAVTNTGIVDMADLNLDSQPDVSTPTGRFGQWFDVAPIYAAPRSEWVRFVTTVPSLANATGGGYAVSRNFPTLGLRELLAADLEFGTAFSGVQSTDDGTCRDQTSDATSNIQPGLTLLAGTDCPPTWPLVDGVETFRGHHPVSAEAFLASKQEQGDQFNFDWWLVDESLIDQSKIFGNFQTYGAYDDYNSAMIGRFGDVVPGGAGDPDDEGWPLGLRTDFDAFTFALPTVGNSMVWRATITNKTRDVYGEGLDYENLYVGYTFQPIRSQESSFYFEVWRGTIMSAEGNTGSPSCPGQAPPGNAGIDCVGDVGFNRGVTAQIVLKSPIGDLRNVLLTCDPAEGAQRAAERAIPCPTDAFNDPFNVHAGDTITYNHFTMCPYGGNCGSQTLIAPDRQMFGALASNTEDVLNGRDIGTVGQGMQYSIWRNPNFPQQPTPFAYWVPGSWDYTGNGETPGGDTIYVPTCYGPPGVVIKGTTRENRADACVVTWSDTMPVGELGNSAYNNQEGNVSYWSVGPFALAADSTTALVIALVAQGDSASFEEEVNNVIDLYMNFYLSPEAPPKVNIVGVDVQVEDPSLGAGRGEVTLFWDDASDDYVDPFLEKAADDVAAAAPGTERGRLKALNPDLEDRIRERARDNLERILIYKSCDNGDTYTANDTDGRGMLDCDADPAQDVQGRGIGAGWQAYAVLAVDGEGQAPNSYRDQLVIPGQNYLYVIVGQSRGAQFAVVDSLDVDGDGDFDLIGPDSLLVAPSLTNPLATAVTEPNVASVYVPASVQAGAQLAEAIITEPDTFGFSTGPFVVQFTGRDVVEAPYRVLFGNQFELVEVRDAEGAIDTLTATVRDIVYAETGPGTADSVAVDSLVLGSENPNGVDIAGEPTSVTVLDDTTVTVLDGLGFLLYRVDTGEPLLMSTELDSANTTPSTFFGRQAEGGFTGFPGFVVNVDDTEPGEFDRSRYLFFAEGDTIPNQVLPTLAWDNQASVSNQAGGISAYGRYEITFADFTFGPGAPFELNFVLPDATQGEFVASLAAREAGSTGRTDATAAAAINAAGLSITEDDLVAVKVPFSVRNTLFGRDVDVAMVRRANNDILLGRTGTQDTLTVTVPEDEWVPGDQLYFLEDVQLDSLVEVAPGDTAVVLENGKPKKVTRTVATFAPAVLSCRTVPRESCNPVQGDGTTNDWVTNVDGQVLLVFYVSPYQLASRISFETQREITGEEAIEAGLDIRAQMDSVRAVPNPYIMFSEYQIATAGQDDMRLLFTHLPPRGVLRIFTVSGQFVQEISWEPDELVGNGDLYWNMRTREGNEVGSGLYVFVVQATNPATGTELKKIGKFVVIR